MCREGILSNVDGAENRYFPCCRYMVEPIAHIPSGAPNGTGKILHSREALLTYVDNFGGYSPPASAWGVANLAAQPRLGILP